MSSEEPPAQPESGIGSMYVGAYGIAAATVVLLLAVVAAIVTLGASWPTTGPDAPAGATAVHLFGLSFTADVDQRLFLTVSLSGALGGLLHSVRSLYWYVGNRALKRSWLVMYLCLPFVGAAMAVVFYLVLRGGLVPGGSGSNDVNAYGFAAVSALVGMFSPQASEKLRQIFSTLLTPAETGKDAVVGDQKPQVLSLTPSRGPVGTTVRVFGVNLDTATEVLFGDESATATVVSASELTVAVPQGASTGPIQVKAGDQIIPGPAFEVVIP